MNVRFPIAFLLPLVCLAGCTTSTTPATQTTASSTSITGNWQIQSGTAITSPPTAPYLVGALEGSYSALTGTFSWAEGSSSSPAVESYSGTYNASTSSLTLNSTAALPANQITTTLSVPAIPTNLSTGTLKDACGLCSNGFLASVVAVQVAPLNGTYTGTLSGTLYTDYQTTNISGTVSLVLTQSTTPNSSGQFPLTGTVTFPSVSGAGTATLPGLVSGITLELSDEPCTLPPFGYAVCNVIGPGSTLRAYTNPTATQITVTGLSNINESNENSVDTSLSGTLTLQQ